MIEDISPKKIKIKNLIGIINNPTVEDLLFEIIMFLKKEQRLDSEFIKAEVTLKTRCRINKDIIDDLKELVDKGFLEHKKYTKYRVIDHPWK
jgi:hypothetical protein